MKVISLLVLLQVLFVLSSCTKDDDTGSTTNTTPTGGGSTSPTKTQLLTAHKWVPTALTFDNNDAWGLVDDCEKDNFLEFKTNGSYKEDEGATKCDPNDPQIINNSTWKFTANNTKLEYHGGRVADINGLTATELRLQYNDLGTIVIATYKPQ